MIFTVSYFLMGYVTLKELERSDNSFWNLERAIPLLALVVCIPTLCMLSMIEIMTIVFNLPYGYDCSCMLGG